MTAAYKGIRGNIIRSGGGGSLIAGSNITVQGDVLIVNLQVLLGSNTQNVQVLGSSTEPQKIVSEILKLVETKSKEENKRIEMIKINNQFVSKAYLESGLSSHTKTTVQTTLRDRKGPRAPPSKIRSTVPSAGSWTFVSRPIGKYRFDYTQNSSHCSGYLYINSDGSFLMKHELHPLETTDYQGWTDKLLRRKKSPYDNQLHHVVLRHVSQISGKYTTTANSLILRVDKSHYIELTKQELSAQILSIMITCDITFEGWVDIRKPSLPGFRFDSIYLSRVPSPR